MPDMENKVNLSAYKKEMKDVLQRFVKTMPAYKEVQFFMKYVINHYLSHIKNGASDIVVIGSNIPEELFMQADYTMLSIQDCAETLYDNMDKIPFDKLEQFFNDNLE